MFTGKYLFILSHIPENPYGDLTINLIYYNVLRIHEEHKTTFYRSSHALTSTVLLIAKRLMGKPQLDK